MESYCKGEKDLKESVNDDLDSLFENIRLGKEPNEEVLTYFLPKLTEEELEKVEKRHTSYLQTFVLSDIAYVDKTGAVRIQNMFKDGVIDGVSESDGVSDGVSESQRVSESDSQYVQGRCYRRTFVIENSSENSIVDRHCGPVAPVIPVTDYVIVIDGSDTFNNKGRFQSI